ncbi:MAG TPA: glycosyl hydrolase 108 family protein [Usitatibacter sp.]|nr:glycosyl hydrolase 108 family protein [Usitatibacter sp.]
MTSFESAFDHVVGVEGGYSDRAADRGGKTKYGITERVARAHGYQGEMRDLPLGVARDIYKAQYWDTLRLDQVAEASYPIALELFDTGVNMGIAWAGRFLQRALNALNHQARDYADMTVDGIVGPVTVAALRAYLARRNGEGEVVLLGALNGLQAERYISIAEADPVQEENVYGWLRTRTT